MKKKIIEKISVMLITMLLISSVFGNVVADENPWENMTMEEIIANYDPNCQNMTEEEIAIYIEEVRIQTPPEVIFDDPENYTKEPLISGSHSPTFEPPWSVHYIANLTEEFGLGTQGGWQGDTDGYQGWTDVMTSANLAGEISITNWLVQGFYFLAPVTDTYTFTFDYDIKGNHWGQIHGIINPFPSAVASSQTVVDFEVGSITERENIAYDQTIPLIYQQYNNNFNEHLIHTIECQLSEGTYYLVRAVGGTKARSLGIADAAAETHNKLDDYSESGWGDGVIINSIVINWPNHPPETPEEPDGPSEGTTGIEYTYLTEADDPDGDYDSLHYKWDWGDEISDWLGPYDSGEYVEENHTWNCANDYDVKVKVKDFYDEESSWSSALTVTITTNNPPYEPTNPYPEDGGTDISITADLSWTGGDPNPCDTVTYDVYFGTANPPPQVSWGQASESYEPGTMNYFTKYYWKIVATDNHEESTEGPLWDFTTQVDSSNNPPELDNGYVNPTSGHVSEEFIFGVTYSDSDGDWPTVKKLHVIKEGYHLTHNAAYLYSGDPESGAEYRFGHIFYNPGNYQFYFIFNDGQGHEVRDPDPGYYYDLHIFDNYLPTLTDGDVSPDVGNTSTAFTYEVEYTDLDGDSPTVKKVYIDDTPYAMSLYSGDYETGAIFRHQTTLPPDEDLYEYYFLFNDGQEQVRLPSSGSYDGPSVYPEGNQPPDTPSIPSGPSTLEKMELGEFSTSADDPEGHLVQYRFDWDADGYHEYGETDLGSSGHVGSLSHFWNNPGTYVVKAQAIDQYHFESNWSDGMTVNITGEDSWPMFGHDPCNNYYSSSTAPNTPYVSWSFTESNEFKYSTPVVANDKIFIISNGKVDRLYCFDATPSDGVDEGQIDPPGSSYDIIWKHNGSYLYKMKPALIGDYIIVSEKGSINCYNVDTGAEIWKRSDYTTINKITIAYGKIYGSGNQYLYCLNVSNGDKIWTASPYADDLTGCTVSDGKVFYCSLENDILYCLDAENKSVIWTWDSPPLSWRADAPAAYNGRVYMNTLNAVYCLDADGNGDGTTNVIWSFSSGELGFRGTPVIAYGKVYTNDFENFYCLDADGNGDGTTNVIWTTVYLDEIILNQPIVADGKVFHSYQKYLLWLDAEGNGDGTTNVTWWYETPDGFLDELSSLIIYNGSLYVAGERRLYCFEDIEGNHRPNVPGEPDGPTGGMPLIRHYFSSSTTDLDGDDICYRFDWGDGTFSDWIGPVSSGETVEADHRWMKPGYYLVKVQAKDSHDAESDWSVTVRWPDGFDVSWSNSFGYAEVGSSSQTVQNMITGSVFTTDEYGTADNITAYINQDFMNPGPYKCMIYRLNDSKLIGTTTEDWQSLPQEIPYNTSWWAVFNFTEPKPVLEKDTQYVLTCWGDDEYCRLYYDVFSPPDSCSRYDAETYGTPPDPASLSNESRVYSIYCSYTPTAPEKPTLWGPLTIKEDIEYTYNASTIDPDENASLYYQFDWGDNSELSDWIGPFASGATCNNATHTWTEQGYYDIKVRAKDESGDTSCWSDALPIVVPFDDDPEPQVGISPSIHNIEDFQLEVISIGELNIRDDDVIESVTDVIDDAQYYYGAKIKNIGSTDIEGYLRTIVRYFDQISEQWITLNDPVNDTTPRTINSGRHLALGPIFKGRVHTRALTNGNGNYRVYAVFGDSDGNVLKCADDTYLVAKCEFTVTGL